MLLYDALRWPLPKNSKAELKAGEEITDYLWRGFKTAYPAFRESDAAASYAVADGETRV
jgi:hypothetical protein